MLPTEDWRERVTKRHKEGMTLSASCCCIFEGLLGGSTFANAAVQSIVSQPVGALNFLLSLRSVVVFQKTTVVSYAIIGRHQSGHNTAQWEDLSCIGSQSLPQDESSRSKKSCLNM